MFDNSFAMAFSKSLLFSSSDAAVIKNYKSHTDAATKFIPGWVKVAVALGQDDARAFLRSRGRHAS